MKKYGSKWKFAYEWRGWSMNFSDNWLNKCKMNEKKLEFCLELPWCRRLNGGQFGIGGTHIALSKFRYVLFFDWKMCKFCFKMFDRLQSPQLTRWSADLVLVIGKKTNKIDFVLVIKVKRRSPSLNSKSVHCNRLVHTKITDRAIRVRMRENS